MADMTNYERIKNMSVEEMAELINRQKAEIERLQSEIKTLENEIERAWEREVIR